MNSKIFAALSALAMLIVAGAPSKMSLASQNTKENRTGKVPQASSAKTADPNIAKSIGNSLKEQSTQTQSQSIENRRNIPSLKIVDLTPIVKPGESVFVRLNAPPKATCKITTIAGAADKADLPQKTVGENGLISWSFKLKKNFRGRRLPVKISSSINGKKESVKTFIPVQSATTMPTSPAM